MVCSLTFHFLMVISCCCHSLRKIENSLCEWRILSKNVSMSQLGLFKTQYWLLLCLSEKDGKFRSVCCEIGNMLLKAPKVGFLSIFKIKSTICVSSNPISASKIFQLCSKTDFSVGQVPTVLSHLSVMTLRGKN